MEESFLFAFQIYWDIKKLKSFSPVEPPQSGRKTKENF